MVKLVIDEAGGFGSVMVEEINKDVEDVKGDSGCMMQLVED